MRRASPLRRLALGKLTDAKLLQVCKRGRCRYYQLASPLVAQMLESIVVVAADRLPRPHHRRNSPQSYARLEAVMTILRDVWP